MIVIARGLIAALVLLLLQPASAEPATYSIDMILPLTGPAAFAGRSQEDAARAYETIVNKSGGIHGQTLHFDIHDDQSNPTVAVQIVNELLPKHPIVILGPDVTATCGAVSPLFINGPVNFCFSPAIVPPRGGYVFASSATLQSLVYAGYSRARKMGCQRLGVLIATDASGQQDQKFTPESLALPENRSLQLVAMETFSPTDISVAAQVAKIKAAKPDLIFVWAIGSAFGTALRRLPPNVTAAQLRDYIGSLHNLAGLFGTYDFRAGDQHGLDGSDSRFIVWDGAGSRWQLFTSPPPKAN